MSYLDSLLQVSETLIQKGLDPIVIRAIPEELESEDILELVNDGLIGITIMDMNVGSINNTDANIHAGFKYHKKLKDHYFSDENIAKEDRSLFIFAGYNAGPNRINRFRKITKERGLDPNKWFGNVEVITAEKIGRETVQYIQNIYNYYVAYTMMNIQHEAKLRAKIAMFNEVRDTKDSELSKKE